VPLPLSKRPRAPKDFIRYHWELLKQRSADRLQRFVQSWATKPKWNERALIRSSNSEIIAAARSLHASMSSCLAKGGAAEKAQLGRICVPKLYRSLLSAVQNRPKGKSYEWERVAETGWPRWPRVVDNKWVDVDMGGTRLMFRQAVVGIKSKQRLSELNARGDRVSQKERELLEYIVLWRQIHPGNLTQGDWKIFGTLKETTYEDIMQESNEMDEGQRLLNQQKLDKERRALRDHK
jgi:mitochondrial protein MBA1